MNTEIGRSAPTVTAPVAVTAQPPSTVLAILSGMIKVRQTLLQLCWILLLTTALLGNSNSYAEEPVLDEIQAKKIDGEIQIWIKFLRPMQYLGHTPPDHGTLLQVDIQPVSYSADPTDLAEPPERESLSWSPTRQLPLSRVVYTEDRHEHRVTLYFQSPVRFQVQTSTDFRALIVTLSGTVDELALPPPQEGMVTAPTLPPLPRDQEQKLKRAMASGRQALMAGNNAEAVAHFSRVLRFPPHAMQQHALELLGLARERNGQLAHAKAEYEKYLHLYPKGEDAARVRQRLAVLISAGQQPRALRDAKREEGPQWEIYGSFGQSYRRDQSHFDGLPSRVDASEIDSDLNINTRYQDKDVTISTRFSGGYLYDLLDKGGDSDGRISNLYADINHTPSRWSGRVGRQTHSGDGVLGRFDGLFLSRKQNTGNLINLVAGNPVASTRDGFDNTRSFYGTSYAWKNLTPTLDLSAYLIEQRNQSLIDRRAIGSEFHYTRPNGVLFGLVDYDLYLSELNIATLLGNWTLPDQTVISLTLDQRHSPGLTTTNALTGQSVTTLAQLLDSYSETQIQSLALDRSLLSRTLMIGVNHLLNQKYQINGDLTLSHIGAAPESGGVAAIPETYNDIYFNLQLIGNAIWQQGDINIFGVRLASTTNYNLLSLSLNSRLPRQHQWRLNPRLRIDWRKYKGDSLTEQQVALLPAIRADYSYSRAVQLELESGLEWRHSALTDGSERDITNYITAGYRIEF